MRTTCSQIHPSWPLCILLSVQQLKGYHLLQAAYPCFAPFISDPLAKILAPSPWVRYRKESIEMSPRCCDCCRLCPLATVGSAPSAQDQLLHASGKTTFKTECIKHIKVKGVMQWTLKLRPRQECEHCESIRFTGSSKLRDCEDCSSKMFPKVTCLFAYKWQTISSGAMEYCNSDCIQETLCKSSWYFWW